jgi:hypothetical protein
VSNHLAAALESEGTYEQRIEAFFYAVMHIFADLEPHSRIVDREFVERHMESESFLAEASRPPFDALKEIVRRMSPDFPADETAYMLLSLTYGVRKNRFIQERLAGLERILSPAALARATSSFALRALASSATAARSGEEELQKLRAENDRLRRIVTDLMLAREPETAVPSPPRHSTERNI